MPLHLEKKAIRALGVAESFSSADRFSTLAGVVMRSDLVIDGFGLTSLEVSGSDATESVLSLVKGFNRNDINIIFLSGSVLSLYNIVDVDLVHKESKIPVVALTFKKSHSDLVRNIQSRFDPREAKRKIDSLEKLGTPQKVPLKTGYTVYVRTAGITNAQAAKVLDKFVLQGAIPEPIRVSRLFAKAVSVSFKQARSVNGRSRNPLEH